MPVYKFSHQLLAVLVHLAHTAVKWKTNFLVFDVGDKLVNTDDTALMKYVKKFMQKAVSIMYTVYSFKKEHGRCFHPKSLLRRSKSRSLAPRLLYVSITHFSSLSQSLVMMTEFEQSHLHVEFHQKVIESWVGIESEHIA